MYHWIWGGQTQFVAPTAPHGSIHIPTYSNNLQLGQIQNPTVMRVEPRYELVYKTILMILNVDISWYFDLFNPS
jgi:hypothetical protein